MNENDELKKRKDGEKMVSKKKKKRTNVSVKKCRGWRERVLIEKKKRQSDGGGMQRKRLAGEQLFLIFRSSQMEYLTGLSVKFNYPGKTPS